MAVSKKKSTANETTARHVWLAGLGLLAVSRRQAIALAGQLRDGVGALKQRVERGAAGAQNDILHGIDAVRSQVDPRLAKLRASQFSDEVESRLAPVLVKLGLKPRANAQRTGRKAAAKKPIRRAAPRKPAQSTKRVARKSSR